ncbi:TetR/AcrR family transcriptional regulator [Ilyomonas limi]|uniref:TetR/AcrR family transcriptional regulator n=1 Tax=Ilyomonas limi TaxID=2575867 RepID=A0A4U3KUC1_9BACT|nr:TetR/AcrR family transcriptional regulator [Ilyomonas limi]TKK66135.1 TetR/AcrR family transcriptional regulator [Ilyomonas limi]
MATRDTGTEQLIKDTAKRIFFAEGKLHATTQDIADAAGISRTSLHYYYRSKDELIKLVFNEAMDALSSRLNDIMESAIPFREKIEHMVDVILTEAIAYPYQETFVITEMLSDSSSFYEKKAKSHRHTNAFLKEVEAEMTVGHVKAMNPVQFMMNLFSLTTYPLIVRPLQKKLFKLTDKQYDHLMNERKKLICDLIFQ